MKLKTLAKMVLIDGALIAVVLLGTVLISGSTKTMAAENQSDWTTTLNVKLALLNKLGTDSLHIDVDSSGGDVMLKGMVHKRETRELAETVAESVDGVKSVNNEIKLEAKENDPNKVGAAVGEAESEVKDAMLETKIRLALGDKMGSDGFRVGTEAASGVVTLEFDPDFPEARRQEASKVVKGVKGVTKVVTVEKE